MRSGLRVRLKSAVPAVKDVCPWHPRQLQQSPPDVDPLELSSSIGSVGKQTTSGQRNRWI